MYEPLYRRGYDTGRKARAQGRPKPLLVDVNGSPRSPEWIAGMEHGYKGGGKQGRTPDGELPKETINVRIDRGVRLAAIAAGINRSRAAEMGMAIATALKTGQAVKITPDRVIAGDRVYYHQSTGATET